MRIEQKKGHKKSWRNTTPTPKLKYSEEMLIFLKNMGKLFPWGIRWNWSGKKHGRFGKFNRWGIAEDTVRRMIEEGFVEIRRSGGMTSYKTINITQKGLSLITPEIHRQCEPYKNRKNSIDEFNKINNIRKYNNR